MYLKLVNLVSLEGHHTMTPVLMVNKIGYREQLMMRMTSPRKTRRMYDVFRTMMNAPLIQRHLESKSFSRKASR